MDKALTDEDGLNHQEAESFFMHPKVGSTYFQRYKHFDVEWISSEIDMVNMCIMLVGFEDRDHKLFCVDQ